MTEVRVSESLAHRITSLYGPERTARGRPSAWDFWSGPLQAALVGFRDFDNLRFEDEPALRILHLVDPVFGALVFVGLLLGDGVIELADVDVDVDYWASIEDDPED